MANPLDPNANPFVSGGMRRRLTDAAAPRAYAQDVTAADTYDPYEGNYVAETARSVARRTAASVPALESLGRKLVGDDEGAQVAATEAMRQEQIADEQGPDVQRFDQVNDVGSALKFAGYQAAGLVPDLAMSLTGAGFGAAVGRRAGVGLARRSAQALARREAAPSRYTAMREAYKQAGVAPGATREMQRDAAIAAAKNANKGVDKATEEAARIVGLRTPLDKARVDRFAKFGQMTGATAGQFPGMNRENAELLADPETDQADAAKLALGTTAASALGALPVERFLSRFGGADAVKAASERFLPRVAKEAGKQGLAEGAAEVAQTATQLAAHKWVNDNIDLIGPDAFNQYLAAFVGGSLAGGMLGGAGEAGRAAGGAVDGAALRSRVGAAANTAKEVGGSLRDRLRASLAATADRVRPKAKAPVSEGETAPAGDEGKGFNAADAMQTARDVAAGAGRAASAAQKKWEEFRATLVRYDDLEASTEGAAALAEGFEKGNDALAPTGRNAQSNPIALPTKLQNVLAANFDRSHPIWEFPEEVSGLFASAEKLFTGDKITPQDQDRIDILRKALPPGVVDVWESAGDKYGPDLIRATQVDATEDDDDTISGLRSELTSEDPTDARERMLGGADADRAESAITAGGLSERDMMPAPTLQERIANLDRALRDNPADTQTRTALKESVLELRRDLMGPVTVGKYPHGSNVRVLGSNKPEHIATFNDLAAQASRVELMPLPKIDQKGNRVEGESSRALLSIDSLVNKALAQNERDFARTPKAQKQRRVAAIRQVFGDLISAGVRINPASITAGPLGKSKSNDMDLGSISEAEAAHLRAMISNPDASIRDVADEFGDGWAPEITKRTAEEKAERLDGAFEQDMKKVNREVAQGEDVVDSGKADEDRFKLAPRGEAPGTATQVKSIFNPDKTVTEFVPSQGGVSDADADDPYAELVARVKARTAHGKDRHTVDGKPVKPVSTKESIALKRAAGREIGRAEIERDDQLSDRTKARMLRNLERDDALAMRYYTKAARGDYQRASAREVPVDKEQIDGEAATAERFPDDRRYPKKVRERVQAGREADSRATPSVPVPVKNVTNAPTNAGAERTPAPRATPEQRAQIKAAAEKAQQDFAARNAAMGTTQQEGLDAFANRKRAETEAKAQPLKPGQKVVVAEPPKPGEKVGAGSTARVAKAAPGKRVSVRDTKDGLLSVRYDSIDDVAGKTDGDHDYKRETAMLNAILDDLGIVEPINIGPLRENKRGSYNPLTSRIEINPALKKEVRAEVLMHELGHHIVTWKLNNADPKTKEAIEREYAEWLAKRNADAEGYVPVPESALPLHSMRSVSPNKDRLQDFDEWMADNLARALTTQKRPVGTVAKFFGELATLLRSAWRKLTKNERSKFKPAKSVDAWVRQMYSAADARRALGPFPAAAAKAAEVAAVNTVVYQNPMVPAGPLNNMAPNKAPTTITAMARFVRDRLTPDERLIIERAVGTGAADKRLRELYKGEPAIIKLFDSQSRGMEYRIAAAYFAWARGQFVTGPQGRSVMAGLSDDLGAILNFAGDGAYAQQLFRDIESGALERIRVAGREYDVKARTRRAEGYGAFDAGLVRLGNVVKKISDPWSRFIDGKGSVMRSWGIPAMRKLDAALHQRGGSTDRDRGLNNAIVHRTALFLQKAGAALNGLSQRDQARVMRALQAQLQNDDPVAGSKAVWKAVAEVRKLMDEAYAYAIESGLDVPRTADYFPVVVDIRNDAAKAKLHALLSQPKFAKAIAEQGTTVDDLVAYAARRDDFGTATTGSNAPNFKAQNKRTMAFVYKLGDDADRKTFASLQAKDPAEVFANYFEPLVKRAEYASRFGEDGAGLDSIIQSARAQGATDAQVNYALGTVEAALGTYGAQGSPVLKAISPALAERLKGRKSQATIDGIQAYQNLRLLPLATLSSLVDPMGIAVRSGGDFGVAWKGFKTGVRALFDKTTREDIHRMLATLGAAEDLAGNHALHTGFGGSQSPAARRVNDFIFRANGLSQWTQTTRFMALESAHAFLIKHAGSSDPQSKRYLDELGLKRADIGTEWHIVGKNAYPRVKLDSGNHDRDQRVKAALLRFVDEAILRPNPQQMPLWHSDPYMGLVTQYKSFAYAIFDQIGGRIAREMGQGNMRVLLPTLAYIPMALLAELLRELAQHGPEGNPKREEWGADDYLKLAAEKTSLAGPRWGFYVDASQDVSAGRMPGSSQIGPTLGQARDTVTALNGRRDLGKTFEESLPLSPLWKAWNDDGLADNVPIVAATNLVNGET